LIFSTTPQSSKLNSGCVGSSQVSESATVSPGVKSSKAQDSWWLCVIALEFLLLCILCALTKAIALQLRQA